MYIDTDSAFGKKVLLNSFYGATKGEFFMTKKPVTTTPVEEVIKEDTPNEATRVSVTGMINSVVTSPNQNGVFETHLGVAVVGRSVFLTIPVSDEADTLRRVMAAVGSNTVENMYSRNVVMEVTNDYVTGIINPVTSEVVKIGKA